MIKRGWRKVLVCRWVVVSSSSGEMEVVEVGWDDEEINECILHTETVHPNFTFVRRGRRGKEERHRYGYIIDCATIIGGIGNRHGHIDCHGIFYTGKRTRGSGRGSNN